MKEREKVWAADAEEITDDNKITRKERTIKYN